MWILKKLCMRKNLAVVLFVFFAFVQRGNCQIYKNEEINLLSNFDQSISFQKDSLYISITYEDACYCTMSYIQVSQSLVNIDPSYIIYTLKDDFPALKNVKFTTLKELLLKFPFLEKFIKECEEV